MTRWDGIAGGWCRENLRLVISRLSLGEITSLLKGIVVLLLLDGIGDSLQGRLGRRHGRGCEEGVGWTYRSDSGSE